jgi:hypothetical protein
MIKSQIEIIEQGIEFLNAITNNDYTQPIIHPFKDPPGVHIRHIIDHYNALKDGFLSGKIDYNLRKRKSPVEQDQSLAIIQFMKIIQWFLTLTAQDCLCTLKVITEVSLVKTQSIILSSTLGREFIFVGSHTIHHYAMMTHIKTKKIPFFGIAPTTASFLRS